MFPAVLVGGNVARVPTSAWDECTALWMTPFITLSSGWLVSRLSWCGRCLSSTTVLQFEKEERRVKAKDLLRM